MGIFDRLERSIERGVNGAFAKAFRSEVQPVEIASAMRRAMDDRAVSAGKGRRHIVPNLFVIELSTTDYEGLVVEHEAELADDLIATASEHADSQRYEPGGPISVQFTEDEALETGVFRLRPSTARQVQPDMHRMPERRPPDRMPPARPHDDPRRPVGQEPPGGAPYSPTNKAAPRRVRRRPWLDIDGDRYPLLGAITVIGRDDDVDVVLDDPGASRRHSEIRITFDGPHQVVTIRDLGSTNGTYVNGDPITSTHLSDGDRITIGRTHLLLHEGGAR